MGSARHENAITITAAEILLSGEKQHNDICRGIFIYFVAFDND